MATVGEEYRDILDRIQTLNDQMLDMKTRTAEIGPEQTLLNVWEELMGDVAELEGMLTSSKNKNNPIFQEILKEFREGTIGPMKEDYKLALDEHKQWVQGQKDRFKKEDFQDRIKEIDFKLKSLKGPKNILGKGFYAAANKIAESFVPSGTEQALAAEPGKMEDIFNTLTKEKQGLEAATKEVGKDTPTPVI